jgi:hypothetical protein
LFPFNDHEALSRTLLALLGSPAELSRVRTAGLALGDSISWPLIGDAYFEVVRAALSAGTRELTPDRAVDAVAVAASGLPELRLDHLLRMTDDTGIVQHAAYSVPARSTGYCVDDNARALIVAVNADRVQGGTKTRELVTLYLSYLYVSQQADGSFRNFMSYDRVLDSAPPSDDCIGRAIWALSVAATGAADEGCRSLAREMLTHALPHASGLGLRGTAQVVLGIVDLLAADPGAAAERRLLDELVAKLLSAYRANASDEWRWFESTLTYDNALLPLALLAAYSITGDLPALHDARESLAFLEDVCFDHDQLALVGNTGWHSRGGDKAPADEQAIDATALVLAFSRAYAVTKDRRYLRRMREAFAWFLGANRLGLPLYDFTTGGCHDGIGVSHVNRNQGAESTICFLMALLEMLDVGGDTVELGAPQPVAASAVANATNPH